MNIAILGTGKIGGTLGKKWAKAGHTVRFGARDPQKPEVQALLATLGDSASVSGIAEAIDFGEIVVFAIPGPVMEETIAAHAQALDGKILVDSANNINSPIRDSMAAFTAHTPNAQVYRAFNSYGFENFENPIFDNIPADLFYCGPDGEPRAKMETLISAVGLNPLYVGGPEQVGIIDGMLALWFTLVHGQKMGRHLAFKVLKS